MTEKLFDGEFFSKLNMMKIITKMRMNGGMSGQRKSGAKGNSVEFSDFREYISGDDIRRIDWNAYARMDKLFVKEFMEEKEGLFHILIDCSKSMDFGIKNKSVRARQLAAMLAYMALQNLDCVYLTALYEKTAETGSKMVGRQAFPKVLGELERMQFYGKTSLCRAVKSMSFKQRGTVFLISDFLQLREGEEKKGAYLEELLKYLTFCKQEVILFQVLSSEEENPFAEGTWELMDMETDEKMKITMTGAAIKEYNRSLHELKNNMLFLCKKYGAVCIPVSTEEALEAVLYQIMRTGCLCVK